LSKQEELLSQDSVAEQLSQKSGEKAAARSKGGRQMEA
jgi:hypothetical protein